MANKSVGKLFFQAFLLLILLFGLVDLIVTKSSKFAVLELVVLAFLLLLSVIGLTSYKNSGNKVLFFVFMLYTVNVLVLWYFNHSLYLVLLVASLVGFAVSMPSRARKCGEKSECCGSSSCETNSGSAKTSSQPPQKVGESKVVKVVESKESATPVKAKFTPGKYVASKRSNVYHEPKCEWAKKIQKGRRVWFVSREEALSKGYKKHGCVN
ncbi:MAG: hypothetical protein AABX24_05735 [Nanoarchaeota archaeon]